MSDKIIVVFGITGNQVPTSSSFPPPPPFSSSNNSSNSSQGGSVASIFVKERGWKVRGITRDATKDSAQAWTAKDAEVVSADLDDVESLKKACQGAYAVFGNTDFWVHYQNPAIHNQAKKEDRPANELAYEREVCNPLSKHQTKSNPFANCVSIQTGPTRQKSHRSHRGNSLHRTPHFVHAQ
jgi:hypothetical protein